ncbi:hypothetical protein AAY23_100516 [Frankia casuarinae]|nr:hypothetical protein AAY23_100516 [Frankia casuarinae]
MAANHGVGTTATKRHRGDGAVPLRPRHRPVEVAISWLTVMVGGTDRDGGRRFPTPPAVFGIELAVELGVERHETMHRRSNPASPGRPPHSRSALAFAGTHLRCRPAPVFTRRPALLLSTRIRRTPLHSHSPDAAALAFAGRRCTCIERPEQTWMPSVAARSGVPYPWRQGWSQAAVPVVPAGPVDGGRRAGFDAGNPVVRLLSMTTTGNCTASSSPVSASTHCRWTGSASSLSGSPPTSPPELRRPPNCVGRIRAPAGSRRIRPRPRHRLRRRPRHGPRHGLRRRPRHGPRHGLRRRPRHGPRHGLRRRSRHGPRHGLRRRSRLADPDQPRDVGRRGSPAESRRLLTGVRGTTHRNAPNPGSMVARRNAANTTRT